MLRRIRFLLFTVILAGYLTAVGQTNVNEPSDIAEDRRPPRATLVINEFMAANGNSVLDPQNEYEDWIELYNYGTEAVDAGGLYVTDNLAMPAKWRIPADAPASTTVPAGGYLLIWADGDTADTGLHTNFKLTAGGEQIGLFAGDGTTELDSVVFGAQTTNISYGRYPDGDSTWRFFGQPSPGAQNVGVYDGFVDEVEFSHSSGLYDVSFSVTLATKTKDADIYYTLDGTDPYQTGSRYRTGILYTGPIPITRTTYLRAIAVRTGWMSSGIAVQAYTFIGTDVLPFSSNLPIAVIDTLGKNVSQPTETLSFATFIDAPAGGRAKVTDAPDFAGRAGINVRGKSSAGFAKKQYHFETWDKYGQGKDVSILGFPADSDWVLQGPYSDKSLMRNFLAYRWSNAIGRYAVRTRFFELFLNTDGGALAMSDYVGVYVLMEKIKQGKNRVDIAKLDPADNAEPQITGGYIVKKDKLDGGEPAFSTSRGLQLIYVEPSAIDITPEQKDYIRNYINTFEAALYGSNYTDPAEGYAKYIDVGSFIDHHIIVELAKNIDGFRISTYMFKDRGGKLNMGPVWDYDLSLGNADYNQGWLPSGWYYDLLGDGDYPWWRRLFQNPWFKVRYADRWFELRRDLLSNGRLLKDVDDTAALINESQARNFDRWKILGIDVWPNWFIAKTFYEEINWMRGWIADRLAWMDGRIATEFAAAPPAFNPHGGHFSDRLDLTMAAPNGAIYYTLDGNDPYQFFIPQNSGLLVSENAEKRVLVPVRPSGDNWKDSVGYNDTAWLKGAGSPGGVGYEKESGYEGLISLNVGSQMYGKNATCYIRIPFTFSGNPGSFKTMTLNIRYDDGFIAYLNGVELARRNVGRTYTWNSSAVAEHPDAEAVQFENIDVSDVLTALQAGNNLLAIHGMNSSAADADFLISAELIAGRGDSGNDTVPGATQYTSPIPLTKSTQVKARILNGATWSALTEAVYAVGPVAENLRITEIMYHPQAMPDANDPNEEFIELTNIGPQAINLNLVRFTNGIDFTFPDIELTPGQYTVVVQDRSAFEARYGTNINIAGVYSGQLNNAGERIALEDANGQTILDFKYSDGWRSLSDGEGFSLTVINPADPDLSSWDHKDAWRASAYAGGSPGQDDSGIIPNPGAIVINEVLAHAHAQASDWIELYNTTGTAINIGGWFLSDSKDNLFKYQIANGTSIGAGRYLVLYQDLHFGNANAPGCREPFALSENGESLYLSSAQNGVLTGYREVEDFGASETSMSFGRYYRASTDDYNFVAMEQNTPGAANAYPKVGPVVISEIMYHPDWPVGGLYTNDQYEYIELYNISSQPVTLYDYVTREPWKFTNGIEFTFPTDAPVTIPAGGYVLVVQKPEAFMWRYPSVPAGKVLGPYDGKLSDAGESVELSMPGDVDNQGRRYYIRIDRVNYSDGAALDDLWPPEADGQGRSLTRKLPTDYGNDPANWIASIPSPGR